MRKWREMEFSKKLLFVIMSTTAIVIGFTIYIVIITGDTSPLHYLIPALFTEVSVATGFYYWKAKRENEIKLQSIYEQTNQNFQQVNQLEDGENFQGNGDVL